MANEVKLYEVKAKILGDSLLPKYVESIRGLSPQAQATLDSSKFQSTDGSLAGSWPFALVHMQDTGLLPKEVIRLATRPDLEFAISRDENFLSGVGVDCGLALRTAGDKDYSDNDLPAKRLARQLKSRGIPLGTGKLLPFYALTLKPHRNSVYGLVFDLHERATAEDILDLGAFHWDSQREGLSCACLNWGRNWSSWDGLLGSSIAGFRVVGIAAEGGAPKIVGDLVTRYQNTRQKYIAELGALRNRINTELQSQ